MEPENVVSIPVLTTPVRGHAARPVVPRPAAITETFALPVQIYTQSDVSKLDREMEGVIAFFEQAAIKGANANAVPQISFLMNALIDENKLNILHKEDRDKLGSFLHTLREKAPVVHTSFATDPKPEFLMKLIMWFRTQAHPYVLFQVGLQPNIAAGCIIRTTNKYFDLSFKRHFEDSKAKLALALREKA